MPRKRKEPEPAPLVEDEASGVSSGSEEDAPEQALARIVKLLGDDAADLLEQLAAAQSDEEDEAEDLDDEEDNIQARIDGSDDDEGEETMYLSAEEPSDDEDEDEPLVERELEDVSDDEDAMPTEKLATDNQEALERVLAKFRLKGLDFFDTQTLTYPQELDIPDASDDLKRELQFYKQALWAAEEGQRRFAAAGKPFKRPDDFFAEMIKSDDHMARVRQKLLDQSAGIKASEEAKRQRHLKKFGKKVQVEKRLEREREKKQVAEKVKDFRRKRKGDDAGDAADDFDIALDDDAPPQKRQRLGEGSSRGRGSARGRGRGGSKISRRGRDVKFGFGGGDGRRSKQNDRKSLDGPSSSRGRGGSRGGRGARGGSRGQSRPGKSRREASRGRR